MKNLRNRERNHEICNSGRNKFRRRLGFTLTEVLIVVAILGVLAGIGIPGIAALRNRLQLRALDDCARQIFVAAQNGLTAADAAGKLDPTEDNSGEDDSEEGSSDDNIVWLTRSEDADKLGKFFDYAHLESVIGTDKDGKDGQFYAIKVNYDTASVLEVLYTENAAANLYDLYKASYSDTEAGNNEEKSDAAGERRKNFVGQYDSEDIGKRSKVEYVPADIEIENELNLQATMSSYSEDAAVSGMLNGKTITFDINVFELEENEQGETVKVKVTDETSGKEVYKEAQFQKTITFNGGANKESHESVSELFDSLKEENRFKDILSDFTPGADIEIAVYAHCDDLIENDKGYFFLTSVKKARTNSLFESINYDETDGNQIVVANSRHLQNLDVDTSDFFGLSSAAAEPEELPEDFTAETEETRWDVIQSRDIDWADTKTVGTDGKVLPFHPISNSAIENFYTGKWQKDSDGETERPCGVDTDYNVIGNLVINDTETSGASGLFREFSGGSLNNIYLINPQITAQTSGDVGGLVGTADNTKISGCHVWMETEAMKEANGGTIGYDDSEKYVLSAPNAQRVGGLVGYIENGSGDNRMQKSSASWFSVRSEANSYVGGLVGEAKNTDFGECYADSGILTKTVGENGEESYSWKVDKESDAETGISAKNGTVGGLIGKVSSDVGTGACYSMGRISSSAKAGGFAGTVAAGGALNIRTLDSANYDAFCYALVEMPAAESNKNANNYGFTDGTVNCTGIYSAYRYWKFGNCREEDLEDEDHAVASSKIADISDLEILSTNAWTNEPEGDYHPYGLSDIFAFSKLKDLPHYGDWPFERTYNAAVRYFDYDVENYDLKDPETQNLAQTRKSATESYVSPTDISMVNAGADYVLKLSGEEERGLGAFGYKPGDRIKIRINENELTPADLEKPATADDTIFEFTPFVDDPLKIEDQEKYVCYTDPVNYNKEKDTVLTFVFRDQKSGKPIAEVKRTESAPGQGDFVYELRLKGTFVTGNVYVDISANLWNLSYVLTPPRGDSLLVNWDSSVTMDDEPYPEKKEVALYPANAKNFIFRGWYTVPVRSDEDNTENKIPDDDANVTLTWKWDDKQEKGTADTFVYAKWSYGTTSEITVYGNKKTEPDYVGSAAKDQPWSSETVEALKPLTNIVNGALTPEMVIVINEDGILQEETDYTLNLDPDNGNVSSITIKNMTKDTAVFLGRYVSLYHLTNTFMDESRLNRDLGKWSVKADEAGLKKLGSEGTLFYTFSTEGKFRIPGLIYSPVISGNTDTDSVFVGWTKDAAVISSEGTVPSGTVIYAEGAAFSAPKDEYITDFYTNFEKKTYYVSFYVNAEDNYPGAKAYNFPDNNISNKVVPSNKSDSDYGIRKALYDLAYANVFPLKVRYGESVYDTLKRLGVSSSYQNSILNLAYLKNGNDKLLFNRWCQDKSGNTPYYFTAPVTRNIGVYATWKSGSTVTYHLNYLLGDEDIFREQLIANGSKLPQPPTPARSGYVFEGWYKSADGDEKWTFSQDTIERNTDVYAHWSLTYSVSYSVNDVAVKSAPVPVGETVKEGATLTKPQNPVPVLEQYSFEEWCTDADGNHPWKFADDENVDEPDKVIGDTLLYAKWNKKEKSTVTFYMNEEEAGENSTVYFRTSVLTGESLGDSIPGFDELNKDPKSKKRFDGWFTSPKAGGEEWTGDKIVYAKNLSLYAHWTYLNNFNVTIKLLDFEFDLGALFGRYDYSETTLYDQMQNVKDLHFTIDTNGKDVVNTRWENDNIWSANDTLINRNTRRNDWSKPLDIERNGLFDFAEFLLETFNPADWGYRYKVKSTAVGELVSKLFFRNANEFRDKVQVYVDGKRIDDIYDGVVVSGNRMGYYYLNDIRIPKSLLYDKETETYKDILILFDDTYLEGYNRVTFNPNGKSVIGEFPSTVSVEDDNTVEEPSIIPEALGYTFKFWSEDPDASPDDESAKYKFSNGVNRNIDLYAIWEHNQYTVRFDKGEIDADNVSVPDDLKLFYGDIISDELGLTPGEVDGYEFEGWYDKPVDGTLWNFATDQVTEDMTLYAYWTPKYYTVTFSMNGKAAIKAPEPPARTVPKGSKIDAPSDPETTGYGFKGWSKSRNEKNLWDFENDTVDKNTVLFAWWEEQTTVLFDTVISGPDYTGFDGTFYPERDTAGKEIFTLTHADPSWLEDGVSVATFDGWYTDPNLIGEGYKFGGDSISLEELTVGGNSVVVLYPKWSIEVKFFDGAEKDEKLMLETTAVYGYPVENVPLIDENYEEQVGKHLVGWEENNGTLHTQIEGEPIVRPMELHANWSNMPSVTFMLSYDAPDNPENAPDYKAYKRTGEDGSTINVWYSHVSDGEYVYNLATNFEDPAWEVNGIPFADFAGWYEKDDSGEFTGKAHSLKENSIISLGELSNPKSITLYPRWTVSLQFNNNSDVKPEIRKFTLDYGQSVSDANLDAQKIYDFFAVPSGTVLVGWSEDYDADPDGSADPDSPVLYHSENTDEMNALLDLPVERPLVFYAIWKNAPGIIYDITKIGPDYSGFYGKFQSNEIDNKFYYSVTHEDPTWQNVEFDGWYRSEELTGEKYSYNDGKRFELVQDEILYPRWLVNITFHRNYENASPELVSGKAVHGLTIGASADIGVLDRSKIDFSEERPGYNFLGWSTRKSAKVPDPGYAADEFFEQTINGPRNFYAVWSKIPTVTFVRTGEEDGAEYGDNYSDRISAALIDGAFKYQFPDDAKDPTWRIGESDLHFEGWYTSPDFSGTPYGKPESGYYGEKQAKESIELVGDITLYPKWIVTVSVDRNLDAEELPLTKEVVYGTSLRYDAVKEYEREEGKIFLEWNEAKDGSGIVWDKTAFDTRKITEPLTFYAIWDDGTSYHVVYENNYKPETRTGQLFGEDDFTTPDKPVLNANPFTRTGYAFVDWAVSADGSGKHFADQDSVSADDFKDRTLALYAQWRADTYSVFFVDEDGNRIDTDKNGKAVQSEFTIEKGIDLPALAPAAEHTYDQLCWTVTESYTDAEGVKHSTDFAPEGSWTEDESQLIVDASIEAGNYGNVVLKAHWIKTSYVLTFDLDGGTIVYDDKYPEPTEDPEDLYSKTYTISEQDNDRLYLPLVERNGYEFIAWNVVPETLSADNNFTFSSYPGGSDKMPLPDNNSFYYGDATFKVDWRVRSFTATFDFDGGEPKNPTDYEYDQENRQYLKGYTIEEPLKELPTGSKPGFVFAGWKVTFDQDPNSGWSLASPEDIYAVVGDTRYEHHLNDTAGKYGNVTFTAVWDGIDYTAKFDVKEGRMSDPEWKPATEGADLGLYLRAYNTKRNPLESLPTAIREGYDLVWVVKKADIAGNWIKDSEYHPGKLDLTEGSVFYGDVTFEAVWTPKSYTATFLVGEGGSIADPALRMNDALTYSKDYSVEDILVALPTAERPAYDFQGWKAVLPEGENDGNWWDNDLYMGDIYPENETLDVPEDPGYYYGNVIFEAQWTAHPYTAIFKFPSHVNETGEEVYEEGVISGLSRFKDENGLACYSMEYAVEPIPGRSDVIAPLENLPIATRDETIFHSWRVSEEGGSWWLREKYYSDGEKVSLEKDRMYFGDVTFTAVWTPEPYTATFFCGVDGTIDIYEYASEYKIENEAPGLYHIAYNAAEEDKELKSLPHPTRNGYDFQAWILDLPEEDRPETWQKVSYGSGPLDPLPDNQKYSGNVSFTAKWEPHAYTATFDLGNEVNGARLLDDSQFEKIKDGETYKYRKTFYLEDNPETKDVVEETLTSLPMAVGTGYELEYWFVESVDSVPASWTASSYYRPGNLSSAATYYGSVTFTPSWKQLSYSASFDCAGGTIEGYSNLGYKPDETGKYLVREYYVLTNKLNSLPMPVKPGYKFVGWHMDSDRDFGNWAYDTVYPAGDLHPDPEHGPYYGNPIFVAQWEPDKYMVKFDCDEGYIAEKTVEDFKLTEKDRFSVKWPALTEEYAEELSDDFQYMKWYAVEEEHIFKELEYVDADGEVQTESVATLSELPKPMRKGYDFVQWAVTRSSGNWNINDTFPYDEESKSIAKVTGAPYGHVTLTAEWKPSDYSASFDCAGGRFADPESAELIKEADGKYTRQYAVEEHLDENNKLIDCLIVLPIPVRDGYTFTGWSVSQSENTEGHWKVDNETIFSEIGNGGIQIPELPAGTDPNYYFGNVTFTAHWEPISYTASFVCEKGAIDPNTKLSWNETKQCYEIEYISDTPLTSLPKQNDVNKDRFALKWVVIKGEGSWTVGSEYAAGELSNATSGTMYGDVTFEAKWNPMTYKVTFETDGGSVPEPVVEYSTGSLLETLPELPVPEKGGYDFVCWKKTKSDGNWGEKTEYSLSELKLTEEKYGNVTFKAEWRAKPYTLTFVYPLYSSTQDYYVTDSFKLPNVSSTVITNFTGWRVTSADSDSNWHVGELYGLDVLTGKYGDATLEAQGEFRVPGKYIINFYRYADSSTVIQKQECNANQKTVITFIPESDKDGYRFKEWKVKAETGNWAINEVVPQNADGFSEIPANKNPSGLYVPIIGSYYGQLQLYAEWELIPYTATFDYKGGTDQSGKGQYLVDYTVNSAVTVPESPVKEGYTFTGWKVSTPVENWHVTDIPTEEDGTLQYEVGKHGNVTIEAQWEKKTYTATFDPNGGTVGGSPYEYRKLFAIGETLERVLKDSDGNTLPVEKNGCDFIGWAVAEGSHEKWNGTAVGTDPIDITEDKTIDVVFVAQWAPKPYTIQYEYDGGSYDSGNEQSGYSYGETFSLPVAKKDGYIFLGWQIVSSTGNWPVAIEGRPLYNGSVNTGKDRFGDVVFRADWALEEFEISYNLDKGTLDGTRKYSVKYTTTGEKADIVLPSAVRAGGEGLRGWKVDTEASEGNWKNVSRDVTYALNENPNSAHDKFGKVTFFADWDKAYTATFLLNGGTWQNFAVSYTKDGITSANVIALDRPEYPGYDFRGWKVVSGEEDWIPLVQSGYVYESNESEAFATEIGRKGNVTFGAVWDANPYTIEYQLEEGDELRPSLENNKDTYYINRPFALYSAKRAENGWELDGWTVDAIVTPGNWETNVIYRGEIEGKYGDIKLKPVWRKADYKIAYDFNGGSPISDYVTSFGNGSPITLPEMRAPQGYVFDGWEVIESYGSIRTRTKLNGGSWSLGSVYGPENLVIDDNNSGDVAFRAQWCESFTAFFNLNGGATQDGTAGTFSIDYTDKQSLSFEVPVRQGYEFLYWEVTSENSEDSTWKHLDHHTVDNPGSEHPRGDVQFKAIWKPIGYTAWFEGLSETVTFTIEQERIELPILQNTNKEQFAGWKVISGIGDDENKRTDTGSSGSWVLYDAVSGAGLYDHIIDGKVVLTREKDTGFFGNVAFEAYWIPKEFTATFDYGSGKSEIKYTYQSKDSFLPEISQTRTAYTPYWQVDTEKTAQDGTVSWNAQSKDYVPGTSFENQYGDVTFSIAFKPIIYTATFEYMENNVVIDTDQIQYTVEGTVDMPSLTTDVPGYTPYWTVKSTTGESNWETEETIACGESCKDRYGTVIFTNILKPDPYTATFDYDGGNGTPKSVKFHTDEEIVLPANAVKVGYTLNGWKVSKASGGWTKDAPFSGKVSEAPYGNVTLKADWTAIPYSIVYIIDGVEKKLQPDEYTIAKKLDLPVPENKTGYEFSGWKVKTDSAGNWTDGELVNGSIPKGKYGDITLSAQWKAKTGTIGFGYTTDPESGTVTELTGSGKYYVGKASQLSVPALPVISGYENAKLWTLNEKTETGFTVVSAVKDLTEQNGFVTLTSEVSAGLDPEKTYVLVGNYKATDKRTIQFWNADSLISTVYVSGGMALSAVKTPATALSGKVFAGWYKDKELTNVLNFSGSETVNSLQSSEVINVYAKYVPAGQYFTVTVDFMEQYVDENSPVSDNPKLYPLSSCSVKALAGMEYSGTLDLPSVTYSVSSPDYGKYFVDDNGVVSTGDKTGISIENGKLKVTASADTHYLVIYKISNPSAVTQYEVIYRFANTTGITDINNIGTEVLSNYDSSETPYTYKPYGDEPYKTPNGITPLIELPDFAGYTRKTTRADIKVTDGVVYVDYSRDTYTLTFDSNGGSAISQTEETLPIGCPIKDTLDSKTPTRSGYTFAGWDLFDAASDKNDQSKIRNYTNMPAHNVYAVAKWDRVTTATYTVTVKCQNANDNNYTTVQVFSGTVQAGSAITCKDFADKANFADKQYFDYVIQNNDVSSAEAGKNYNLEVKFDRKTYEITFADVTDKTGNFISGYTEYLKHFDPKSVKYGATVNTSDTSIFPASPITLNRTSGKGAATISKIGYWVNTTYGSSFTMPATTVNFTYKSRNSGQTTADRVFIYVEDPNGAQITRGPDNYNFDTKPTKKYRLYEIQSKTQVAGTTMKVSDTPSIQGYHLSGYMGRPRIGIGVDADYHAFSESPASSFTMYNYGSGEYFMLFYDRNVPKLSYCDASGTLLNSVEAVAGTSLSSYANNSSYPSYYWYNEKECLSLFDFTRTMPDYDITLYGKENVTVTFSGSSIAAVSLPKGNTLKGLVFNDDGTLKSAYVLPESNGQVFSGWKKSDGKILSAADTISSNLTVTAVWTAKTGPSITERKVAVTVEDKCGETVLQTRSLGEKIVGTVIEVPAASISGYRPKYTVQQFVIEAAENETAVTLTYDYSPAVSTEWTYTTQYIAKYGSALHILSEKKDNRADSDLVTVSFEKAPEGYENYRLAGYEVVNVANVTDDGNGTVTFAKGTGDGQTAPPTVKYYLEPNGEAVADQLVLSGYSTVYDGTGKTVPSKAAGYDTSLFKVPDGCTATITDRYTYYDVNGTQMTADSYPVKAGSYQVKGEVVLTIDGTEFILKSELLTLSIAKRTVILTSKDVDGVPYTGEVFVPDPDKNIEISGDGFVSGEGIASVTMTDSIVDPGEYIYCFDYTLNGNTNPDNYNIIVNETGRITVRWSYTVVYRTDDASESLSTKLITSSEKNPIIYFDDIDNVNQESAFFQIFSQYEAEHDEHGIEHYVADPATDTYTFYVNEKAVQMLMMAMNRPIVPAVPVETESAVEELPEEEPLTEQEKIEKELLEELEIEKAAEAEGISVEEYRAEHGLVEEVPVEEEKSEEAVPAAEKTIPEEVPEEAVPVETEPSEEVIPEEIIPEEIKEVEPEIAEPEITEPETEPAETEGVVCTHENTVIDAAVEATCTATGLTEGVHCADCGEVLVPQEIVPMAEHTVVIDEMVAPTETEDGLTRGKHCAVCGEILVPQEKIDSIEVQRSIAEAEEFEQHILSIVGLEPVRCTYSDSAAVASLFGEANEYEFITGRAFYVDSEKAMYVKLCGVDPESELGVRTNSYLNAEAKRIGTTVYVRLYALRTPYDDSVNVSVSIDGVDVDFTVDIIGDAVLRKALEQNAAEKPQTGNAPEFVESFN